MHIDIETSSEYQKGHTYIQLNDKNVTTLCFEADDQAGYVWLYILNDKGSKFLVDGDVATEQLLGDVGILVMPNRPKKPCNYQVTTETVAFYPPTQKETLACYRCRHWAIEVTEFNKDRTFIHGEAIKLSRRMRAIKSE